ncbi:unnamed protein product, partial [Chrysoparadoxa australica]
MLPSQRLPWGVILTLGLLSLVGGGLEVQGDAGDVAVAATVEALPGLAPKASLLVTEPAVLRFEDSTVCIPSVQGVTVMNVGDTGEERIEVSAASLDHHQFEVSAFEPVVLQPQETTTLQIAFLPQSMGALTASLKL